MTGHHNERESPALRNQFLDHFRAADFRHPIPSTIDLTTLLLGVLPVTIGIDEAEDAAVHDGIRFSASKARFGRSKLYCILTDRAYIGEVKHKGQWHPSLYNRPQNPMQ